MKQPLAIVGASTRSAASSAVRAGFQPIAADLFADADLRLIARATRIRPYPDGLLDWLRAVEPPAWMYTGALENHPELVDQMAWIAPLLGNPGDVLARVRSPWELADSLQNAGLLFPETRPSSDGMPNDGTWLTKSYHGASGSGVRPMEDTRRHAGRELAPESTPFVFQRRVEGTPCAAVYVAADGTSKLLGITRQLIGEPWLGAHGFQYAGSIGTWPISESARATLVRLGEALAAHFELVGLFGVDFILNGDQVWTVEVNPRYTASVEVVERSEGIQAIAAHVAACNKSHLGEMRAGRSTAPARYDSPFHGKAILFAKRDVIVSHAFADHALARAIQKPWPSLADITPGGELVEIGRPILTLFAEGATVDEVEGRLRSTAQELEQRIYMSEVPS